MSSGKNWQSINNISSKEFICWSCNRQVASDMGYYRSSYADIIYICPNCSNPNFFEDGLFQFPAPAFGEPAINAPDIVEKAYEEARRAFSASAYTASALMCRKILMNICVEKGAKEGETFKYYVGWLKENHYAPPHSDDWIDHIRKKGNSATHEIPEITQNDAEELITFCSMILKFVYEFPAKIKEKQQS